MKRAVLVIVATVAGLVAVLSFHTKPGNLTFGVLPTTSTSVPRTSPTTSGATGPPSTSSSTTPGPSPATTGSATGDAVNYNYGVLSVSVTVSGSKITKVDIASLDDGGNFRSQSIDQQSVPMLEQQALQAQNANIQGVSGASYTSAGFQQSLQSALGQLNFK